MKDNVSIEVDSYYVTGTYSGVYAGGDPGGIEVQIKNAQSRLARMWGDYRPVVTLVPDSAKDNRFPRWEHMAWLTSARVPQASPDAHGSHLFVIWWTDGEFDAAASIAEMLSKIDWETQAVGFWY